MLDSELRHVSSDQQFQPTTVVVKSSYPTSAVDFPTISAKKDDIVWLLFVDMQEDNDKDVTAALKRLYDMFDAEADSGDNHPGVKKRKEASKLGGIVLLIIVMNKWATHHDIQEYACICLSNLIYTASGAEVEMMVKAGGIDVVVGAMKAFPCSEDLQAVGLLTLMNILTVPKDESKVVNNGVRVFVDDMDGIPLILRAMRQFPTSVNVLLLGCHVLFNMSFEDDLYHNALVKSGAVIVAATVQQDFFDNGEVKVAATEFMSNMFPEKTKKRAISWSTSI
jgi:hypothetical protein